MTNDNNSKCPTCGQLLVSSNANTGSRKDKRGKGSGTTRTKSDSVPRPQGASDKSSDSVGTYINVAFAFSGGDYAGKARVIHVGKGLINIEFPWRGMNKQIQISESEVVSNAKLDI